MTLTLNCKPPCHTPAARPGMRRCLVPSGGRREEMQTRSSLGEGTLADLRMVN